MAVLKSVYCDQFRYRFLFCIVRYGHVSSFFVEKILQFIFKYIDATGNTDYKNHQTGTESEPAV